MRQRGSGSWELRVYIGVDALSVVGDLLSIFYRRIVKLTLPGLRSLSLGVRPIPV